jgi:hypothetical protein
LKSQAILLVHEQVEFLFECERVHANSFSRGPLGDLAVQSRTVRCVTAI